MLGMRRDCEAALGAAEAHLQAMRAADPAHGLLSADRLGRMQGSCYLALGDSAKAESILEGTARRLQGRHKTKAIILRDLALAHVRQRDVDQVDEAIPETIHDFRVDLIVTPDEAIWCTEPHRPPGILWEHLDKTGSPKSQRWRPWQLGVETPGRSTERFPRRYNFLFSPSSGALRAAAMNPCGFGVRCVRPSVER
jgi:hypothetical protein